MSHRCPRRLVPDLLPAHRLPAHLLPALGLPALALAALSACTASSGQARPGAVRGLPVITADFRFAAPRSVPAGLTRVRLHNDGPQFHHVQLVRLEGGHTAQDLVEQLAAGNLFLPWATYVGGPDSPLPGGNSEVSLFLEAGSYAMICFISGPDGVPHFAKGMVRPLTVTPFTLPARPEPPADTRLVLDDFSFSFTPELRPGRRTLRVENVAAQPHEAIMVRLAPGKSVGDLLRFAKRPEGPPPGEPVAGTSAIAPGRVNFVSADFAPGRYALLCFVPDASDGKPHFAHGMVREFEIH